MEGPLGLTVGGNLNSDTERVILTPFKLCKAFYLGLEESVKQSGSWQGTRLTSDGSNARELMKE